MRIAILSFTAVTLTILGQAEPAAVMPYGDLFVQGGAVAVLAWLLMAARKDNTEQRKDFTSTLDRVMQLHQDWEQTRHEDSVKLNEALATLQSHCAAIHASKEG